MASRQSVLKAFGKRLRAARMKRGWSQEELGRRAGRHWTYIGGLERGERNPSLNVLCELAEALQITPGTLVDQEVFDTFCHPLVERLSCSARDILAAIEMGFRAQIDVKGKLAELNMHRQLETLRKRGQIQGLVWQDKDGQPDFLVSRRGRELKVECKNIRNEQFKKPPSYKVELQRTRNSMDGTPTRAYNVADFDVLGVSLFNQTGKWEFRFVATRHLERRPETTNLLVIMQRVPIEPEQPWTADPLRALDDAIGGKA